MVSFPSSLNTQYRMAFLLDKPWQFFWNTWDWSHSVCSICKCHCTMASTKELFMVPAWIPALWIIAFMYFQSTFQHFLLYQDNVMVIQKSKMILLADCVVKNKLLFNFLCWQHQDIWVCKEFSNSWCGLDWILWSLYCDHVLPKSPGDSHEEHKGIRVCIYASGASTSRNIVLVYVEKPNFLFAT